MATVDNSYVSVEKRFPSLRELKKLGHDFRIKNEVIKSRREWVKFTVENGIPESKRFNIEERIFTHFNGVDETNLVLACRLAIQVASGKGILSRSIKEEKK